MVNEKMNKITS